jgi:hypothetical protein
MMMMSMATWLEREGKEGGGDWGYLRDFLLSHPHHVSI